MARWVKETTEEAPILLLDDALSELDATRRGLLLEEARAFPQSIVTATDATFIENAAALFTVKNGRIVEDDLEDEDDIFDNEPASNSQSAQL